MGRVPLAQNPPAKALPMDSPASPTRNSWRRLPKGWRSLAPSANQRPAMTLSEAATPPVCRAPPRAVSCGRWPASATSRRPGGTSRLTPRILEFGFAYLSTQSWIDRAEPLMKELSHARPGIVLRRDPPGQRNRLRLAHAGAPSHHVDDDRGRHQAPGGPHLARPDPVGLPAERKLAARIAASR